jgi:uncharacterized membrane protein (DUF373 family)
MLKFADRFDRIISMILLAFAMLMVVYQVFQLIWNSILSIELHISEAGLKYAPEYGHVISILFFNVLLILEIMQTIQVFSDDHVVKVRIILIVCLIAVSRKILALGEQTVNPLGELSLASLILSLSVGYFLVSRNTKETKENEEKDKNAKPTEFSGEQKEVK